MWEWVLSNATSVAQIAADLNVTQGLFRCTMRQDEEGSLPYFPIDNTSTLSPPTDAPPLPDELCRVADVQPFSEDGTHTLHLLMTCVGLGLIWVVSWSLSIAYAKGTGLEGKPRCFDSERLGLRWVACIALLVVELPQMLAITFNERFEYSDEMTSTGDLLVSWIHLGDDPKSGGTFYAIIAFIWVATILCFLPYLLIVFCAKRGRALMVIVTQTNVVCCIQMLQEMLVRTLCLPLMIVLLSNFHCEQYKEEGLRFTEEILCYSGAHMQRVFISAVTLLLYYGACIFSTAVGVEKSLDVAVSVRYTTMQLHFKFLLAVATLFFKPFPVLFLLVVIVTTFLLLYSSVSQRPYVVEKMNFFQNGVLLLAFWCAITQGYSFALRDPSAVSPFNMLAFGTTFLIILLILKYFALPEKKPVAAFSCEGGVYEGEVSLGTMQRHGQGSQSWADHAEYNGTWCFGTLTGKGVLTLANGQFYEGSWWRGRRRGYGRSNAFPEGDDVAMYEGIWLDDLPHGYGRKTFINGEIYEGAFTHGTEDGTGKWSFPDGSHLYGHWTLGTLTDLPQYQTSSGPLRYDALHGTGSATTEEKETTHEYVGGFCAGHRHGEGRERSVTTGPVSVEEVYEGGFRNNVRHGYGSLQHTVSGDKKADNVQGGNDSYYEGEWRDGARCGHGVLNVPDVHSYNGGFKDNKFDGFGDLESGGLRYRGGFLEGEYHGKGHLCTHGHEYEGAYVNSVREGHGTYSLPCKMSYSGAWRRNVPHGEGVLITPGTGQYSGHYEHGVKTGFGKYLWENGTAYFGEWRGGLMEGRGVIYFKGDMKAEALLQASVELTLYDVHLEPIAQNCRYNTTLPNIKGGKYDGEWRRGLMHGKGTLTFSDGCTYTGEWDEAAMTGKGVMSYLSADTYHGMFLHSRRQGMGELHYADGRVFVGQWAKDVRHGVGRLSYPSGDVSEGFYFNDVFVGATIEDFRAREAQHTAQQAQEAPELPATECCTLASTVPDFDVDFEMELARIMEEVAQQRQ